HRRLHRGQRVGAGWRGRAGLRGTGLALDAMLEVLARGAQRDEPGPHALGQLRHLAHAVDDRALHAVPRERGERYASRRVEPPGGLGEPGVAERHQLVVLDVAADARIDHRRGTPREIEVPLHELARVVHRATLPDTVDVWVCSPRWGRPRSVGWP